MEALYGRELPHSEFTPVRKLSSKGIKRMASKLSKSISSIGDLTENLEEMPYIDVTVAVQSLVNNSQLLMSGGRSKSNIVGFYDPCFGEEKRLRILYKFQDKLHQLEVDDLAPVTAPMKSHIVVPRL